MALQVCAVLLRRHLPRPAAVLPSGRRVDVLPRRGPRVVVLVVVLGVERLEHELRRLEPPRDVKVARDEVLQATDRRTLAQGAPGKRIVTCASVQSPDGEAASKPDGALGSASAVPVARSATGAVASKS